MKLSFRIAPRAKNDADNLDLRTLLVHRLSETWKSVLRAPLRRAGRASMLCEQCDKWASVVGDVPTEWTCPTCRTVYVMEFAVYEELSEREERLAKARAEREVRTTPEP
jgi:hypothetical protein